MLTCTDTRSRRTPTRCAYMLLTLFLMTKATPSANRRATSVARPSFAPCSNAHSCESRAVMRARLAGFIRRRDTWCDIIFQVPQANQLAAPRHDVDRQDVEDRSQLSARRKCRRWSNTRSICVVMCVVHGIWRNERSERGAVR
jgi:hypothetical protein